MEVSEEEAKEFLSQNNYYMKLASYRTNYEKNKEGKKDGQYQSLDFGYLQELSTDDMHLRYIVLEMCLDIEHAIKVRLIREITNNPQEDGYNIIRKFLAKDDNLKVLKAIKSHKSGEYCKDLIDKYYPYFPAWVFVELISFGTLLYLCEFYCEMYGVEIVNHVFMNIVRDFRNASAHSNCLINKLREKMDESKQPHNDVVEFVKQMPDISDTSRTNNFKYKFTYNFTALLYIYDTLVQSTAKQKRYQQLKTLMDKRMVRHKDYFQTNTKIVGVYRFVKKVVDNLI